MGPVPLCHEHPQGCTEHTGKDWHPGQEKAKTGRIWTYVRDDRNVGSASPPDRLVRVCRTGRETPGQHLRPFRVLQADAFTGYRLFSAEREGVH